MYQILGTNTVLRIVSALTGVMFVAAFLWFRPEALLEWIEAIVLGGTLTIVTLVGINLLWRPLWRRVPMLSRWLFPDLAGTWEFTARSNVAEIAARDPELHPASVSPEERGEVEIRQNLFRIQLDLRPERGSPMRSVHVVPVRDERTERLYLHVLYETDQSGLGDAAPDWHSGAARLEVGRAEGRHDRLTGVYWTNRDWKKARNLAGTMELTRVPGT